MGIRFCRRLYLCLRHENRAVHAISAPWSRHPHPRSHGRRDNKSAVRMGAGFHPARKGNQDSSLVVGESTASRTWADWLAYSGCCETGTHFISLFLLIQAYILQGERRWIPTMDVTAAWTFVAQTPKRKANQQPRRFGEYSQESLFSISAKSLFTFPGT